MERVSDQIRRDLKASGFNRNVVSVRANRGGYDDSVTVTVKDERIPLNVIRQIAEKYRHVERDPWSQEILMGGNCYVFVEYSLDIQLRGIEQ